MPSNISTKLDTWFRNILGTSGPLDFTVRRQVAPTVDLSNLSGQPLGSRTFAMIAEDSPADALEQSRIALWTNAPGGMTVHGIQIDIQSTTGKVLVGTGNQVIANTSAVHQMGGQQFDEIDNAQGGRPSPFAQVRTAAIQAAIVTDVPQRTGSFHAAARLGIMHVVNLYCPPSGDASSSRGFLTFATELVNEALHLTFYCELYPLPPTWRVG